MELIDRIRKDIDDRLEELRPQVEEIPRLESVLAALNAAGGEERAAGAQTARRPGRPRGSSGGGGRSTATRRRSGGGGARRRARRGQRREELLQLVMGNPEVTIAEAARQMGVSAPQVSTLVRRLEEEGVIDRSQGRFVVIAPAAGEATDEDAAAIEGEESGLREADAGGSAEEIDGPGVEALDESGAGRQAQGEAEPPPADGEPAYEEPALDEAGRPQAT